MDTTLPYAPTDLQSSYVMAAYLVAAFGLLLMMASSYLKLRRARARLRKTNPS